MIFEQFFHSSSIRVEVMVNQLTALWLLPYGRIEYILRRCSSRLRAAFTFRSSTLQWLSPLGPLYIGMNCRSESCFEQPVIASMV